MPKIENGATANTGRRCVEQCIWNLSFQPSLFHTFQWEIAKQHCRLGGTLGGGQTKRDRKRPSIAPSMTEETRNMHFWDFWHLTCGEILQVSSPN